MRYKYSIFATSFSCQKKRKKKNSLFYLSRNIYAHRISQDGRGTCSRASTNVIELTRADDGLNGKEVMQDLAYRVNSKRFDVEKNINSDI